MTHSLVSGSLTKAACGIEGLDEITQGGLPRGRASLLIGGPGSGKTILALQTLVNGARRHNEPGIFVTFKEDSRRVITNAAGFGWDLPRLHNGLLERELAARRAEREQLTRTENQCHRQVCRMRGGDAQPKRTNADES